MTKKFWADWHKRIGETKAIAFNNGWLHFYSLFGCQHEFLEKLSFEGEYVTIASATSYDPTLKSPIISIELDGAVTTDDVRIVFQSNGTVFPYIKELEVYSTEFVYGSYQGYPTDRMWGGKDVLADNDFAYRTVAKRSKYLDLISPVQQFIID